MTRAIAILAVVMLALPANAQFFSESRVQMIEKSCIGLWYENVTLDGFSISRELMGGCDGFMFLKSEIDGTGPLREFNYLKPLRVFHGDYVISDPTLTCRIRIAFRRHFAAGEMPTYRDYGPEDPSKPSRKLPSSEVPEECWNAPIA